MTALPRKRASLSSCSVSKAGRCVLCFPGIPGYQLSCPRSEPLGMHSPAVGQLCTSGTLIHRPPHLSDIRGPGL